MSGIEQRLPMLATMRKKHLGQLESNMLDPAKDKGGAATTSLAGTLRFLAVANLKLEGDVQGFKEALSRAASCRLTLFKRSKNGEAIPPSYLAMISYKSLFDALAAGDYELSKELASVMGGRDEIEKENDHPFDRALGYALKALVLNADDQAEKIEQFRSAASESDNTDFLGYAEAFEAIKNSDSELFVSALQHLLLGHKKQCKGSGVFKDSEDEVLCVWGIGLVNLAKSRGLAPKIDDPLIPASLVAC
ncbi:TPA: hypothetical protein RQJ98_000526 [Vibrio vulnificus]|uniref:hypothetical protein n=1 Tax=Vibrio vulnificus TaxID=672 RepID=UPI0005F1D51A|nr:hypothetical protein [Vibrio vulnificus]MCA3914752.1 hypothetical protein [Vibrio vulnificus]MCG6316093.1 immunity 49 family protein [Vibrio vulnificus]HAS6360216.1 hypothetical protein [Vibrio vulnificus]HDY7540875.1 hypothetical protein [Vibrio vulnificus]HDY7682046.1 hypothetical protein [Vibrio vulnificus]